VTKAQFETPFAVEVLIESYTDTGLLLSGEITGLSPWRREDVKIELTLFQNGEILTLRNLDLAPQESPFAPHERVPFTSQILNNEVDLNKLTDYTINVAWKLAPKDNGIAKDKPPLQIVNLSQVTNPLCSKPDCAVSLTMIVTLRNNSKDVIANTVLNAGWEPKDNKEGKGASSFPVEIKELNLKPGEERQVEVAFGDEVSRESRIKFTPFVTLSN
jgi:hypothetical protein